jgi:tetratricopeptide (TPR) repeat protein
VQRVLGDVASALGNWPLAESQYKKALTLRDDPETRLALARIWIPLQRYGEIIEICSPIVDPRKSADISVEQRARALVYTAGARLYEPLTATEIGQLQQQLREADALAERMPQSERFLPPYFMGESLLRSGKPKEAIPFLERSTGLAPMFAGSLYSLARAYRLAGETTKADLAQARHEQLSKHLTELEKPDHTALTHHTQQ